jgi:aminoglycoside phosphotransferase (APT) family kinase protein
VTMKLGEAIANGSRSTVYELGNDAVAKVPLASTPDRWMRSEAEFSTAVQQVGAPVPEFLGFEEHDGRVVSVYRRAVGTLMWDAVVDAPGTAAEHGRRLVELQSMLAGLVPPVALPSQIDRLTTKIRLAARRVDAALAAALDVVPRPQRIVLCHGDMHPGNVILTADGPMIVDWFDAARGDPAGDVARTTILLDADSGVEHLPGAADDVRVLSRLRAAYVEAATDAFSIDPDALARWRAVVAVARIAEGVPPDALRTVWRSWFESRVTASD